MEESDNKQPLNFNINMNNEGNTKQNISSQQYQNNPPNRDSIDFTNFLQHAANPGIVLFTLLFKTLAIVAFLVLGIFGFSDALVFFIGLRWWNEVRDDGTEVWIFESDHEKRATSIDTTLFWSSLYIAPLFWGIFLIIELIGLSLMWFLVCLISFVLTFSNTIGYYKCSGEQKKKLTNFLAEKGQKGISNFLKFGANAMADNGTQNGNK